MDYLWNMCFQDPLHSWIVMDCKGVILQLVYTLIDNATVLSCIGVVSVTTYQSYYNKRKQEETLAKLTQTCLTQLKRNPHELTSNDETVVTEHTHMVEKEKAKLVEFIETGKKKLTELIERGMKTLTEQSDTLAKEKAAFVHLIIQHSKMLNEQVVGIEKERKVSNEVIRHENETVFDQSAKMNKDKETFNECIVKEKNTLHEFVEEEKVTLTALIEKEKSKLTELIREVEIHSTEQTLHKQAAWIEKMKEKLTESIRQEKETLFHQSVHTKKVLNTLTEEVVFVKRENEIFTDFIKIATDKRIKSAERIELVKDEWVKSVKQAEGKLSENAVKMEKETETLILQSLRIEKVKDKWVELVIKKENKLNEQSTQIKTLFAKSKTTEHCD